MKVLTLVAIALTSIAVNAKPLLTSEMRRRFNISEETFVFDASGKKLIRKIPEWGNCGGSEDGQVQCIWSSNDPKFFLKHNWTIQDDHTVKVSIEQYSDTEWVPISGANAKELKGKTLVKKEEKILVDMEPVLVVVSADSEQRIVMRLTPDISNEKSPEDLKALSISGSELTAFDSDGNVWGDQFGIDGKYVMLQTYKYGTIAISYYPFKGAHEFGVAERNKIRVEISPKRFLTFLNTNPFVPEGVRAKIYGIFVPKSSLPPKTSNLIAAYEKEADLLKDLKSYEH